MCSSDLRSKILLDGSLATKQSSRAKRLCRWAPQRLATFGDYLPRIASGASRNHADAPLAFVHHADDMGFVTADSIVMITGGSRGIGLATAQALESTGATIVLMGRNPATVQAAVTNLQQRGIRAIPGVADVADSADLARLRTELGPLGEPDVLIASAGVMSVKMSRTLRTSPEEWRRVLATNTDGVFNAIQTFGQAMAERRSGRIIALSACLGRFSGPGTAGGLAPYRVSKAAVNALIRNLAAELQWGKRGVLVDAVCPGHCRTDMGGPDAPRSADQGADTVAWLATRTLLDNAGDLVPTGLLWEDRDIVPW